MRFRSSARSVTYVVKPGWQKVSQISGEVEQRFWGIRAVFENHWFDSEVAGERQGWSDEEREMVEKHLLAHPDFVENAPGGRTAGRVFIYLDEPGTSAPDPAQGTVLRCAAEVITDEGPQQCDRVAITPSGLCGEHALAAGEDLEGSAQDDGAGDTVSQCQGNTAAGNRCRRQAGESGFCPQHQPAEVVA